MQSVSTHARAYLEQFWFFMLDLEILRNKNSGHKDVYERGVVLRHYWFSATALGEEFIRQQGPWHHAPSTAAKAEQGAKAKVAWSSGRLAERWGPAGLRRSEGLGMGM